MPYKIQMLATRALPALPLALSLTLLACGPGGGGPPPPPAPRPSGLVRFGNSAQMLSGRTLLQSQASAAFVDESVGGCQRSQIGACSLLTCTGAAGSGLLPNAGPLTIGSGGDAITLSLRGDGGYAPFMNGSAAIFPTKAPVPVSAPGNTVSAFTTQITLPGDAFTLLDPAITPLLGANISQKGDLTVSWTGDPAQVRFEVLGDPGATTGLRLLDCSFPGDRGKATVPAAALQAFPPDGSGDHPALMLAGPAASTTVLAGIVPVEVVGINNGAAAVVTFR